MNLCREEKSKMKWSYRYKIAIVLIFALVFGLTADVANAKVVASVCASITEGYSLSAEDSLRLGTQKMTLSMLLEPHHMGGMRYVLSRAKKGSDDFDYALMRHLDGELEFAVAQEGSDLVSVLSNARTPLNEWTHVAVCLDGSEAAIYINGQLDASTGFAQRGSREGYHLWISSPAGST